MHRRPLTKDNFLLEVIDAIDGAEDADMVDTLAGWLVRLMRGIRVKKAAIAAFQKGLGPEPPRPEPPRKFTLVPSPLKNSG
jgi:hypothetical protein